MKRRHGEIQKLATAQEGLAKLEKAMNCEIKRRVDSNKQVQCLTEQMANDMLERLQSTIMARIEKLAASIESLTLRCTALVKEMNELKRHAEDDRKSRIQKDTQLLRRVAEMESAEAVQFETASTLLEHQVRELRAEIDAVARSENL